MVFVKNGDSKVHNGEAELGARREGQSEEE